MAEVNPLDTIVGQTDTAFKEKVEELSGGSITVDLQASGVLGSENDVLDTMLGGGGTIAKYVANRGIKVLDLGVPVLSMHSPFEVIHKTDLYMAYRAFSVFCQSAD